MESQPRVPHNRDQDPLRRQGETIDDESDQKPEPDEVPDTPPTEPEPIPMKEPPPSPEKSGPFIV